MAIAPTPEALCLYVEPLPIITLDELRLIPRAPWLYKGRIRQQSTVLVHGVTDAYKTFMAVDLAARIVSGLPWFGTPCRRGGPVLYIAAESAETIAERVDAWQIQNDEKVPSASFHVMTKPPRLSEAEHMDLIVEWIEEHRPVAVFVDTLSKSMGPNTDENSNSDLTIVITAVDRIKATGAVVFLLHHPGHGNQERERGAYALRAGVDTRILVEKVSDLNGKLSCHRQKTGKRFDPIWFDLAEHVVGQDEDGDDETSLAVSGIVHPYVALSESAEEASRTRETKRQAVLVAIAHAADSEEIESKLALLPEVAIKKSTTRRKFFDGMADDGLIVCRKKGTTRYWSAAPFDPDRLTEGGSNDGSNEEPQVDAMFD